MANQRLSQDELKGLAQTLSMMIDAIDKGLTPEQVRAACADAGVPAEQVETWYETAKALNEAPENANPQAPTPVAYGNRKRTAMGVATERLYDLWIGSKVEMDYTRRGVFPDLRSDNSIYSAPHGSRYRVPRSTIKVVAEDAIEQRALKRSREERGLACSYGTMSKNLIRDLGMEAHVIASRFAPGRPKISPPEYRAGTGRQPVAWSDCLWRPMP